MTVIIRNTFCISLILPPPSNTKMVLVIAKERAGYETRCNEVKGGTDMGNTSSTQWLATVILPGEELAPCPELLTEEEAIRYLRLDTVDISAPVATLRRYREQSKLRATQVSKRLFYRRVELDRFLARLTEDNPR